MKNRISLWKRLRALDRECTFNAAPWTIAWLGRQERWKKADERRRILRSTIKQYTGSGVGGSARRGTPRSVGSSPTSPTNLPATPERAKEGK